VIWRILKLHLHRTQILLCRSLWTQSAQSIANNVERVMERPKLSLPDDFDDYAFEVEAKGWFSDAIAKFAGREFRLAFYDLARLTQDIKEELSMHGAFVEPNIIVVQSVTRTEMEKALNFMEISGKFPLLKAEK
jgi:hypothetical protein